MNVHALFAAMAGIFVLLHFVALLRADALLRRTIASNLIARVALRSRLDLFRTIALVATLSLALTVVTLRAVDVLGGSTVVEMTSTLERMRMAPGVLLEVDPTLVVITTIVLQHSNYSGDQGASGGVTGSALLQGGAGLQG